ncbi:methylenetetrahydrofolate reductase [Gryllotalpicola protaetiae]|uniref:Methylenetetrahydrofolate reductase n=1 Tax=Gryllotalpicola protaetiae TaxID=2419771 RepID=A0A387BU29_9MICO|nr:methylenetetrahydrofolate reductase [Gryllotalpicola protaetiae]AYG04546.1 5,10-methylenetetrahydrofolate reductase [Gryllotalpicola protaetiae]
MRQVPFSFELHPARSDRVAQQLPDRIARLVAAGPEFVSVTYGAGGSSQDASLDVLKHVIDRHPEVRTMAHLTCVGSSVQSSHDTVRTFMDAGVHSFLAVRGDLPLGSTAEEFPGDIRSGAELVQLIQAVQHERAPWREVRLPGTPGITLDREGRERVVIAVAAFVNGHPSSRSFQQDIDTLLAKQAAGANLALTQLFFHADDYFRLVERARAAGVEFPIIPGILPVVSTSGVVRARELAGEQAPTQLVGRLGAEPTAEGQREIGIDFAAELVQQLVDGGAPGIHLYTRNLHETPLAVLARAGLIEAGLYERLVSTEFAGAPLA